MPSLSSASSLLSGWAPPEFKGRTVTRVEKAGGNRRRIIFANGRASIVSKADIARLARQKHAVLANERYQAAPTAERRRISRKSGRRQRKIYSTHLARFSAYLQEKNVPHAARLKKLYRLFEESRGQVGSMYGRRKRKSSAQDFIAKIWAESGLVRPF